MVVFTPPRIELQADLERVRAIFDGELTSRGPFVARLTNHLKQDRGKMLRPTLLLLSAKAVGDIHEAHYVLAAVVEMVHLASLLHDDVLDESPLRRHQPALQTLYGNEAAVLLGDYLFSHAFHLCSSLADQEASRMIAAAAHQLCEGELMQVAARGNWDLTKEQYYEIITGKTALLLSTSCRLGARWAGGTSAAIRRLSDFGLQCGLAYQIVDDILDLVGCEATLGKSVGRDVGMGKLTLPIIFYLHQADPASRRRMIGLLEDGPQARDQIRLFLERSDAVEQAQEAAREHVHRAIDSLFDLPGNPATQALAELAEFILQRQT